jgi:quinol monooxygenase YgiN
VTVLYAEFTVKAGAEDQVAALVRDLTEAVRAEPGNLSFDPYVLEENPLHYVVFEAYRDHDAFEAHIGGTHTRAFNRALVDRIEQAASQLTWLRDAPG